MIRQRIAFGGVVIACLAVGLATPAHAEPVGIGVSGPSDALTAVPGKTTTATLRLSNQGSQPATVGLALGTLSFGDEGAVHVEPQPAAEWLGRVRIAHPSIVVASKSYAEDAVAIDIPPDLPPDTYFVGLLATPVIAGGGNVQVVNQIGAFIALDTPGPRHRSIKITAVDTKPFVFGSNVSIRVRLTNDGPSFVNFWGELHSGGPGRTDRVIPLPQHLRLPAGHSRTVTLSVPVGFGAGPVHLEELSYFNKTDQTVDQVSVQRTVWVISRAVAYAIGGVLVTILGLILFAWRRRRRDPRPVGGGRRRIPARA